MNLRWLALKQAWFRAMHTMRGHEVLESTGVREGRFYRRFSCSVCGVFCEVLI